MKISCKGTLDCLTYLLNEDCKILEVYEVVWMKFGLERQVYRAH